MTLMRVLMDKRTNVGLGSNATLVFAHGLGGAPDVVRVRYITTLAAGANTNFYNMCAPVNATNVTLINGGDVISPDFEVVSIRFHTLIQ